MNAGILTLRQEFPIHGRFCFGRTTIMFSTVRVRIIPSPGARTETVMSRIRHHRIYALGPHLGKAAVAKIQVPNLPYPIHSERT